METDIANLKTSFNFFKFFRQFLLNFPYMLAITWRPCKRFLSKNINMRNNSMAFRNLMYVINIQMMRRNLFT